MNEVQLITPATIANVVCAFDCIGFALKQPFDEMTFRKLPERGKVKLIHHDNFGLTTDPAKNAAGATVLKMFDEINPDFGIEIEITKHIKPGSGIGSSAASAAGAAVGTNCLLDNRFSKSELIGFSLYGEEAACGSKTSDNVAPCIYGGFTLTRSINPLEIVPLHFPELFATVVHPQIEIKTQFAREILPKSVSLENSIQQWANVGGLVAGLFKEDFDLIGNSLEDCIVEPVRKGLIPKYDQIKEACLESGAIGGGISGSGPSVFMLSKDIETAEKIKSQMAQIYAKTTIEAFVYISEINREGVVIKNFVQ